MDDLLFEEMGISPTLFREECKKVKDFCKAISHLFGEIEIDFSYEHEYALLKIKVRKGQHQSSFVHLYERYTRAMKKDYRFQSLLSELDRIMTQMENGEVVNPDDIIYENLKMDIISLFGGRRRARRIQRCIVQSETTERDSKIQHATR